MGPSSTRYVCLSLERLHFSTCSLYTPSLWISWILTFYSETTYLNADISAQFADQQRVQSHPEAPQRCCPFVGCRLWVQAPSCSKSKERFMEMAEQPLLHERISYGAGCKLWNISQIILLNSVNFFHWWEQAETFLPCCRGLNKHLPNTPWCANVSLWSLFSWKVLQAKTYFSEKLKLSDHIFIFKKRVVGREFL